jgi:hypothetical protein
MHYADGSKLRIAWRAYLADKAVMQMLERPSEAEVAERLRQYLADRLAEAIKALGADSFLLAVVLVEILEIATGEAEIVG